MGVEWAAGGSFIVYLLMTYVLARYLNLSGMEFYIFFGLLGALGLTGCGLWIYFKRKARREGGAGGPIPDDASIDQIIREADGRLAGHHVTIANLPLVFVVGDRASTKTSAMVYSGVEPELIAGAAFGEGNMVAPTAHANVWFARGTAFVEAAGAVFADPEKWLALVKRLKPAALKSLVGKGQQAPRGVLLCFDVESFAKPGAADAVAAAARYIQARFAEISAVLGINFPVYVLFTRTDRIQFFTDFVRNFSNEEATQVFGATLPIRDNTTGVYAEEESRRLTEAFNALFHSLCDKRTVFLPREGDAAKTPQPYEFPREFAKLRASIVNFLVEVCRPSQLRASPFLRGFYFAGVRPILVSDAAPVMLKQESQEDALRGAGAATQMFRMGKLQEEMQKQAQAKAAQAGKRVPQWMFLGHLFNGVLLRDTAALAASGSSTKTSGLQRWMLGTLSALLMLFSIGLLVSFFGNRSIEDKAIVATKDLQATGGDLPACAIPPLDSLKKLDSLRQSLEQLTQYQDDGAPMRYRLGLYAGNDLLPEVRKAYYDRFRALLFGQTQKGLIGFMGSRPDEVNPNDDYGFAYDSVKSYLLTAKESGRTSDKALSKFLGTTLYQRWYGCKPQEVSKEVADLAQTQFAFYAGDLQHGNPYSPENDRSVPKGQRYLSLFGGVKAKYVALLARADKEKPPESYNERFKDSAYGVRSTRPVRYAFTKNGYDFMMNLLKKSDFGGDDWVLGDYVGTKVPKDELEKGIRELYSADYIDTWRKVLHEAAFTGYPGGLPEAETKLTKLTSSTSPILCLMWWASTSTNVDLAGVRDAFLPVSNVQPPSSTEQCIVDKNRPYNDALMRLQQTIVEANQPGKDAMAKAEMLRTQASSASSTTRSVTVGPVDSVAQLDKVVTNLMLKPIETLPMPDPGAGANGAGAALCIGFNGLKNKFPFKQVEPEVSLQELAEIFKPGTGKLWQFYEQTGKQFVVCSSAGCAQAPSPPIPVNPQFVSSFASLVRFSKALYGENGTDPNYKFSLKPKSEFYDSYVITVNGDKSTVKAGSTSKPYTWPGPGSPSFALEIVQKGNTNGVEVQRFSTLWSVFRFFANAEKNDGVNFTFYNRSGRDLQPAMINGKIASYDFSLDTQGAPAVFSRDFLASLNCVGRVTATK